MKEITFSSTKVKEEPTEISEVDMKDTIDELLERKLVIFNDDFNTFEHVIETLVRVLKHDAEQAEQCAWIIHHTGRCVVKTGSYDTLKPFRDSICEAGIDAKIE